MLYDGRLKIVFQHIAKEVSKNALMAIPAVRTWRARTGRTSTGNQVSQIRDQFDFFIGTLGNVDGKTVIEIGPGDAIAIGALLLKAGAKRYVALDRFRGDVFGERASVLYRALGCDIQDRDRVCLRGSVEEDEGEPADIIISFDVLEHVRDPHLAIRNMAAMLKPGGIMMHRIDYSAHDVWRQYHEDTFLHFPEWLWSMMGSNRGYPNRVRHDALMATVDRIGLEKQVRVTRSFASGEAMVAEFTCGRPAPALGPQFPH